VIGKEEYMPPVSRQLSFSATPVTQQLAAQLEERLQLNRSALVALALAELARREGLPVPVENTPRRAAWRRPQARQIADPPGPIVGRRTRV
jgi:hypothetical protein